ncbi:MAG TPA: PIN domain-containing protein [Flavisolibacter sp.]
MSGTNYFLDTNAIIALLNGNRQIENILYSATWIGTSVVCIIEFLSFPDLSANDRSLLYSLTQRIDVISIENRFQELEQVANIRKQTRLKLPDSVIAATALAMNAILISNDREFTAIPNFSVVNF